MEILEQVEGTSMRSILIPHSTRPEARNLFESLNEEEWEQWKDGVENGIEKDDWTGILAHRVYILNSQILQLIIAAAKIRIPQAAKIADHTVELSGSHKHKGTVISKMLLFITDYHDAPQPLRLLGSANTLAKPRKPCGNISSSTTILPTK